MSMKELKVKGWVFNKVKLSLKITKCFNKILNHLFKARGSNHKSLIHQTRILTVRGIHLLNQT
jgi:ribosomal protein L20A (L18A)